MGELCLQTLYSWKCDCKSQAATYQLTNLLIFLCVQTFTKRVGVAPFAAFCLCVQSLVQTKTNASHVVHTDVSGMFISILVNCSGLR